MTQIKRAIIHIGAEKTGTTSLQSTLAANRDRLRSQGVLFPVSMGPVNHTRLVSACLDDGVIDNVKAHWLASRRETEDGLRKGLRADLRREMRSGPDCHTLLVSSELVHSRLHSPTEIERLFSFLPDTVERVDIVAVLRRQDQLAVSRFSTALRAGHEGFDDLFEDLAEHAFLRVPPDRDISDFRFYYDYCNLIDRFTPHVPSDRIHLEPYQAHGRRADPLATLSGLLDLDLTGLAGAGPTLNPAMSAEAQFIIGQINKRLSPHLPNGKRDKRYIALKARIEAEVTGAPRTASSAAARGFLARFQDSNDDLCRRFLPGADRLFDDDFSMYPDAVDYADFPARLEPLVNSYMQSVGGRIRPASGLKRALGRVLGT